MVDALNGEPGVYSARYGGPAPPTRKKVQKLLKNIEMYRRKNEPPGLFRHLLLIPKWKRANGAGRVPGKIAYARLEEGGFGYDPVFVVEGGKNLRRADGGGKGRCEPSRRRPKKIKSGAERNAGRS